MDSIPVLSLTAYAPAVGALLIFLVPGFQKEKARLVALIASLVSFVLSIAMAVDFDKNAEFQYHLGLAHAELGEMARAQEAFKAALALDPTFAGADDARARLAR